MMDQLRRKVGPFEIWQWLLIVVVGIGIGILVRRRLGSGSSSGTGGGESGGGGGTQTVGASPGYSGVGGGGGMGPQPSPSGDATTGGGTRDWISDGPDRSWDKADGRSPVLRDESQLGIGGDAGGVRTKPVRLPKNPEPSNVRPIRDPIRSGPRLVAIEVTHGPGRRTRYSLTKSGQYRAPSGAWYVAELHRGKAIRHIYA